MPSDEPGLAVGTLDLSPLYVTDMTFPGVCGYVVGLFRAVRKDPATRSRRVPTPSGGPAGHHTVVRNQRHTEYVMSKDDPAWFDTDATPWTQAAEAMRQHPDGD